MKDLAVPPSLKDPDADLIRTRDGSAGPTLLSERLPVILLLVVAAVWGASYAVVKQVTVETAILEILFIRFGLTALILLPALRPLGTLDFSKTIAVAIPLGATLFAIFLCETFGVSMTSATNAAFLISLCVIFTPFAQWLILGSRPQRSELSAAAVCLLGATLMSLGSAGFSGPSMGDLLMLLAAILRAVMVALTRRFATWHEVPAMTLTALQAWVVTLGALVALGWGTGGLHTLTSWDMGFWVRMSFLVIFCTIFAFVAQNYAAARMRPSKVALLMASEPVFGALFGALLLQELVGGWGLIGGVLMLAATTFAVFRQKE